MPLQIAFNNLGNFLTSEEYRTSIKKPQNGAFLLNMAEREGFEPSIRCRIHTFQACAFDRSAISPAIFYPRVWEAGKDNRDCVLLQ